MDTLSIAGNAVTIPMSWSGKTAGTVVINSNVAGPVVVIAYRGGYSGYTSNLRIHVNGQMMEEAAGMQTSWQSGSGDGWQPIEYYSLPLTAVAIAQANAGNTVITVSSSNSVSNNADVRFIALMVKR